MMVSILLATYQPNQNWLSKQLLSIDTQSFDDYEVLIMDDSSDDIAYQGIRKLAVKILKKAKKISVMHSNKNEGSTKTFEKLVCLAKGKYLAFCDQDDIWERNKLARLVQALQEEKSVLAYSDMSVIDENSRLVYASLRNMRRYIEFVFGEGVTGKFLFDNCAAGCSMLAETELVKKSLPFLEGTYHDQWTAICLSAYGRISFVDEPLVRYRRHSGNQTRSFGDIFSKKDYYDRRVMPACRLLEELEDRGIHFAREDEVRAFAKGRKNRRVIQILRGRDICKKYVYCDIAIILLPDFVVRTLLSVWQKKGQ